jgi:hypothetical protein
LFTVLRGTTGATTWLPVPYGLCRLFRCRVGGLGGFRAGPEDPGREWDVSGQRGTTAGARTRSDQRREFTRPLRGEGWSGAGPGGTSRGQDGITRPGVWGSKLRSDPSMGNRAGPFHGQPGRLGAGQVQT